MKPQNKCGKKTRLNSTATNQPTTTNKTSSRTLPCISESKLSKPAVPQCTCPAALHAKASVRTHAPKATWCGASSPVTSRPTKSSFYTGRRDDIHTLALLGSVRQACHTESHSMTCPLKQKQLLPLHQVVTFPECLIQLNIPHIWLGCFRDATKHRKGIKFKALGCTPQVGFQNGQNRSGIRKPSCCVGILGTFSKYLLSVPQNTALSASQPGEVPMGRRG